jgi:hypothetical protein
MTVDEPYKKMIQHDQDGIRDQIRDIDEALILFNANYIIAAAKIHSLRVKRDGLVELHKKITEITAKGDDQ